MPVGAEPVRRGRRALRCAEVLGRDLRGKRLLELGCGPGRFDAIYSVFGAVGLVAPELLLAAISRRLKPAGVLDFSVPHPARAGRHPSTDDRPREDYVTMPDHTRLPIARWEFDARRWGAHLARTGLRITSALELRHPRRDPWPTTLLITARKR
ncbi:hypothetical protein ACGFSI_06410 [Streptomyces virginiae]|uniref:hypothetical protein n=1 Tax=Streptomyces virginiae TaxID=1961 RepID=UPI00371411AF